MKPATYMSDLHFEHVAWNKELSFQKDELKIFQHRLEDITPRYKASEVLRQVEQYQNIFIRHNEVVDILMHDINADEHKLSAYAMEHPENSDRVRFKDHTTLRERVEVQRNIYQELKTGFFRFLTKTM